MVGQPGIDGTPADAVLFAVLELAKGEETDLVVSGINAGQNVGDVAHFSGTVGAAMTAVFLGVSSVAVSLDYRETDYTIAAQYTARFVTQLKERGAPEGWFFPSTYLPARRMKGGLHFSRRACTPRDVYGPTTS